MFDPLVIDDSAHLDMVLSTGHTPPRTLNTNLRSPLASSSSSSASDSPRQSSRRPKLSDGFSQAVFSLSDHGTLRLLPRLALNARMVRGTASRICQVGSASISPHMAKGLVKEIKSECGRLENWVEEDVVPTPSRDKSRQKGNPTL